METVAQILGGYVESLSYNSLPLNVRVKAKELLLDWMCSSWIPNKIFKTSIQYT